MKRMILILVMIMIIGMIVVKGLTGVSQQEWLMDKDNYGKVVGRIVDADTGEPINEVFRLLFLDSDRDQYGFNIEAKEKTTEQGTFEKKLLPHIYTIQFYPLAKDSKYSYFPYPFRLEENKRINVKVERGKITLVQIEAHLAGTLKIYTVDQNNVKFNPSTVFSQKINIHAYFRSPLYEAVSNGRDDLNDGELTLTRLYPGAYSVEVSFDGLGYPSVKKENIQVEKGKATEVLISMDLNDNTGIEGVLTDMNGIALEGAFVALGHKDIVSGCDFRSYANKNGYYQLRGMPVGYYYMSYYYKKKSGLLSFRYGLVEIKENVMLRMDIRYPYSKSEMFNR